jgi:hypothetical protein
MLEIRVKRSSRVKDGRRYQRRHDVPVVAVLQQTGIGHDQFFMISAQPISLALP